MDTSSRGCQHPKNACCYAGFLDVNQLEFQYMGAHPRGSRVSGFESTMMPNIDNIKRDVQCASRSSGNCPAIRKCSLNENNADVMMRGLCCLLEADDSPSQRVSSEDAGENFVRMTHDEQCGWTEFSTRRYEYMGDFALIIHVPSGETRRVNVQMARDR